MLRHCKIHFLNKYICDVAGENRPTGASLIIEQWAKNSCFWNSRAKKVLLHIIVI